jgi:outer membrane biosynthesis protein TonB
MSATATPPGTPVATATPPQAPAPSNPNGTDNGSGSNDDKKVRDGLTSLAANQNIVEDYKKHDSIIGNYPPEACAAKLDGKSYIEAIVDKQGKFVSVHPAPPSNSTFDNVAISTVRAMPFGATGKTVSHLVPVVFEYDSKVCPSSTTSQRSEQPQNAPTPPQDAPAPKKSPETQNAPTPPQDAPAPKKSPDR